MLLRFTAALEHASVCARGQVPLFISIGEKVTVDTRTDTYLGRASKSL